MCFCNEYDPDILDGIDEDYSKATHSWQPLESLLTVYIDLIEWGKIVALHKSVQPTYPRWRRDILKSGNLMATTMEQREDLPQDPSVPKRLENTRSPWAIVANTEEDLDLALHRWKTSYKLLRIVSPMQGERFRIQLGSSRSRSFERLVSRKSASLTSSLRVRGNRASSISRQLYGFRQRQNSWQVVTVSRTLERILAQLRYLFFEETME